MHYFIVLQIAKLNDHKNTQYPKRYKTTKRIQAITPKRTKEHHKTLYLTTQRLFLTLSLLVGLLIKLVLRRTSSTERLKLLKLTSLPGGVGKGSHRVVEVSEVGRAENGTNQTGDGKGDVRPNEVWVLNGVGTCETNSRGNSLVEQTQSINQALHSRRRTSVGQLVRCNIDKNFTNGRKRVKRNLSPDRNRRDGVTSRRVPATFRNGVNLPLNDRAIDHVGHTKNKANSHSSHGLDGVTDLVKERVKTVGNDRCGDNDSERIKV